MPTGYWNGGGDPGTSTQEEQGAGALGVEIAEMDKKKIKTNMVA